MPELEGPILKIIELMGPAATILLLLYLYDRIFFRKRAKENGGHNGRSKEITQHLDLAMTEHFDQLRRDLETKIQQEAVATRQDHRNALHQLVLDLELFKRRPGREKRDG
jgi:hypothetical protein